MAYPPEKRRELRDNYVGLRLSLEISAARSGVAYGTARRWKEVAAENGDDWDKARAATDLAGGGVENLAAQNLSAMLKAHAQALTQLETEKISAIDRAEILASLADAMAKGMASYARIAPETNQLAVAMRTLELFTEYLNAEKKALLSAFVPLLQDFGARLPQLLAGNAAKK